MATFRMNDPEDWLPAFARGKGLSRPTKIRLHHKDGGRGEYTIPASPANPDITVTDERAIRHLRADPRFTEI